MASILDYINITKVQGRAASDGSAYITSEGNYTVDGTKGEFVKFEVLLKEGLNTNQHSVTVDFTSSNETEGIVGLTGLYADAGKQTSLTFTGANWNVSQYFYVIGADEAVGEFQHDGEQGYSVDISVNQDTTNQLEYLTADNQSALFTNYDDVEDQPRDDGDSNNFGTPGVDYLVGSNYADQMYGSYGFDELRGGYGDDLLYGEQGNDRLYGQEGNDKLYGGYQLDRLYGNDGDDKLYGEQDDDYLNGGKGDDWLDGGLGADKMVGGAGSDTYVVDDKNDEIIDNGDVNDVDTVHVQITAGGGAPYTYKLAKNIENAEIQGSDDGNLFGNASDNVLTGNAANNRLNGGWGDDVLEGGNGNDTYIVNSSDDVVIETNGNASGGLDLVKASANFNLTANIENLTLIGTANINATGNGLSNIIVGNKGANTINAGWGADVVKSGSGNDTVIAGGGDDKVIAGTGNDIVKSGAGNDIVNAGWGNDTITAGSGADKVIAGAGDDIVDAGWGNDTIIAGAGNDEIIAGAGEDVVKAGGGADEVNAGAGNDTVLGGAGVDTINGGAGEDVINGGAGNDILTGGAGADDFLFATVITENNTDVITDYEEQYDCIHLENLFYKKLGAENEALNADFFVTGSKALDANDYIIYDDVTGSIKYDADGNGAGEAVEIAIIAENLSLTHEDFYIV